MSLLRFLSLAVAVALFQPDDAVARCGGAVMLGGLHDAYRATLNEAGERRRQGAMSLLFITGEGDADRFATQVQRAGILVPVERLKDVMADGQSLAKEALGGARSEVDQFRHGLNVRWLADTYARSGCQNSANTTSRSDERGFGSGGSGPTAADTVPLIPKEQRWLYIFIGLVAVVTLGALLGKLYNSFLIRRLRTERLPRTPVLIPLRAAYAFPDGELRPVDIEAVDVSLGGMKLSWANPPSAGTPVSLTLPLGERGCRITWSNAYYAGVMFDSRLTEGELQTLKAISETL